MSPWVPAIVASVISGLVAIAVALWNAHSQRQLAWYQNRLREEFEESAAKREYRYEARKRLYAEVNPQLFQLRESCETNVRRLRRIITGEETVTTKGVVKDTERIFSPLVHAQELQRHLTAVDLKLDPVIHAQYVVSKQLLWTYHEGMDAAPAEPVIPYRTSEELRKEPREHLTVWEIQRLVDLLTVTEPDGQRRPRRGKEFADDAVQADLATAFRPVVKLFDGADPMSRPVLWRLLLAQAFLMQAFIELADSGECELRDLVPDDHAKYRHEAESPEHFDGQVRATEQYLAKRLKELLPKAAPAAQPE